MKTGTARKRRGPKKGLARQGKKPVRLNWWELARDEIEQWDECKRPIATAVLYCFVYRITTGRSVEEDFFTRKKQEQEPEYQI